MQRKRQAIPVILLVAMLLMTAGRTSMAGTAFTYQGELAHDGVAVEGLCDFEFSLWDTAANGMQVGLTVPVAAVDLAAGRFTVTIDFGDGAFDGSNRWLQIAVRYPAGGGPFVALEPRQMVTATPYALFAADTAGVEWSAIEGMPGGFADGVDDDTHYSWSTLPGIPAGFLDGIDDVSVESWATLAGIPAGFADGVDDDTHYSWSTLPGIPPGFADDVDDVSVETWGTLGGIPSGFADDIDNISIETWSTLSGIPAGFADGVDDTVWRLNGSSAYYTDGNVGIKKNDPTYPLDIEGTMRITKGGNNHPRLVLDYQSTDFAVLRLYSGWDTEDIRLSTVADSWIAANSGYDVGIGTTNPTVRLHVNGNLKVEYLPYGDRKNVQWDATTREFYHDNSSRRYKENITPLEDDFDRILDAQPMTYTRPADPDRWEIGFIAEDFHDLGLTRLVDYDEEGLPDGINYEKICLFLAATLRQQRDEIADLKAENKAVHDRLDDLEALFGALLDKAEGGTR